MGWILIFASWITCSDIWSTHRTGSFPLFFKIDSCQSRLFVCGGHQSLVFPGWVLGAGYRAELSGERALHVQLASPRPLFGQSPCADGSWREAAPLTLMTLGKAAGCARKWMIPSSVCTRSAWAAFGSWQAPEPSAPLLLSLGRIHAPCPWITSINSVVQCWESLPCSPAPGGCETVNASAVSKIYLSKKPSREFPCPSSICWSDFTYLVFVRWYHLNTSMYLTSLSVLLHSFVVNASRHSAWDKNFI